MNSILVDHYELIYNNLIEKSDESNYSYEKAIETIEKWSTSLEKFKGDHCADLIMSIYRKSESPEKLLKKIPKAVDNIMSLTKRKKKSLPRILTRLLAFELQAYKASEEYYDKIYNSKEQNQKIYAYIDKEFNKTISFLKAISTEKDRGIISAISNLKDRKLGYLSMILDQSDMTSVSIIYQPETINFSMKFIKKKKKKQSIKKPKFTKSQAAKAWFFATTSHIFEIFTNCDKGTMIFLTASLKCYIDGTESGTSDNAVRLSISNYMNIDAVIYYLRLLPLASIRYHLGGSNEAFELINKIIDYSDNHWKKHHGLSLSKLLKTEKNTISKYFVFQLPSDEPWINDIKDSDYNPLDYFKIRDLYLKNSD